MANKLPSTSITRNLLCHLQNIALKKNTDVCKNIYEWVYVLIFFKINELKLFERYPLAVKSKHETWYPIILCHWGIKWWNMKKANEQPFSSQRHCHFVKQWSKKQMAFLCNKISQCFYDNQTLKFNKVNEL